MDVLSDSPVLDGAPVPGLEWREHEGPVNGLHYAQFMKGSHNERVHELKGNRGLQAIASNTLNAVRTVSCVKFSSRKKDRSKKNLWTHISGWSDRHSDS